MHLKRLTISNFRGLQSIDVTLDSLVDVIVGPNAIGKTTILEAIRFTKALLAPRTQNEPTQVAVALGAVSPHMPQQFLLESLAFDASKPIEISSQYSLSDREIVAVSEAVPTIATSLVQAQAGLSFAAPAALIQFLSSDAGKRAVAEAEKQIRAAVAHLESSRNCDLTLNIDPLGNAVGRDPFSQIVATYLEQRQPPSKTGFSYFPADRALPTGETPVQLGSGDAAAQLESHNSQAQTKYTRLKNTIFGAIAEGEDSRRLLDTEFQRIFSSVLRGKKLVGISINRLGMLSIKVQDLATGHAFDVDSMSSGEKGLILTFLLISRTLAEDGLLLLDEPELHLNPAVCRDILGFLVDQYAGPKKIQAIICSHSAEVLAAALDRDDCSLFHLRASNAITKVRVKDRDEAAVALQRLGSSQSESLLYRGTVFVEGPEDIDLLETGFEALLGRYKVKDLGGRSEVEKQIRALQEAEKNGEEFATTLFIFDLDRSISELKSSGRVKVLQWKRRCIENYLLDVDVLTDRLKDPELVKRPFSNIGEVTTLLQQLAMRQLTDTVAREIYDAYGYESPNIRARELQGKDIAEITDILYARLSAIGGQMNAVLSSDWKSNFRRRVEDARETQRPAWETSWRELCDGKRLFADLVREVTLNVPMARFKRVVMQAMREQKAEGWRLMEALLTEAMPGEISGR